MEVAKVAKMNDAAIAAFDTFGKRKRFRSNTNLLRFHAELEEKYGKIKVSDLETTFKKLQDAGFGSLIVGRKDTDTRFAWNYSLKDVAKLAQGKIKPEEVQRVVNPKSKKPIAPVLTSESVEVPAPVKEETYAPTWSGKALETDSELIIIDGNGQAQKFQVNAQVKSLIESLISLQK